MSLEEIIKILSLKPLEPEGGYFRQTFKSQTSLDGQSLTTAIYYLMTPRNFSKFHRLKSCEIYHFYAGAPAKLSMIDSAGKLSEMILGTDLKNAQVPQAVVPPGVWQAVKPIESGDNTWTLLGTTVTPGFEFEDFELGSRQALLVQYPNHKDVIKLLAPA